MSIASRATKIAARAIFLGIDVKGKDKETLRKEVGKAIGYKPWPQFVKEKSPEERIRYQSILKQEVGGAIARNRLRSTQITERNSIDKLNARLSRATHLAQFYGRKADELREKIKAA